MPVYHLLRLAVVAAFVGGLLMTPLQAFELAIDLCLTAPTDEKAQQATELAEQIAQRLTPAEVQSVLAGMECPQ